MQAEIAKMASYQMEVKKDALRQTQSGETKVTFTINPVDMPQELYSDPMGQRYLAVLVPLSDDETPRISGGSSSDAANSPESTPTHPSPGNLITRAVMLCKDPEFWKFAGTYQMTLLPEENETLATEWLRKMCGVQSRSEIKPDTEAGMKFNQIITSYTYRNIGGIM